VSRLARRLTRGGCSSSAARTSRKRSRETCSSASQERRSASSRPSPAGTADAGAAAWLANDLGSGEDPIADDKILIPGVVDTTTDVVEHPELVAQRQSRFAEIVGSDRVMAGSDCGFGPFAGFGAVDPDIA
jgi:hypothetical protein